MTFMMSLAVASGGASSARQREGFPGFDDGSCWAGGSAHRYSGSLPIWGKMPLLTELGNVF